MTNRKLVRELGLNADQVDQLTEEILTANPVDAQKVYEESLKNFQPDTIIRGKVLNIVGDEVLVDIGYKSEGVVPKNDFQYEEITLEQEIEVFLENVEDDSGVITLSKQKADKIRGWERIITSNKEGDVISGRVIRKIKGGLLVDVGVPVFLPASQVDIRRVEDIGEFLGKTVECKILKIDEKRMNIIVSRRKLLEEQRMESKNSLLTELEEGDVRKGIVKNIADFGAFVDLGGIDGLLHITDMSWGRISHPSDIVALEQDITVKILKVDRTSERIALGLKQLAKNPWEGVASKYPVSSKVIGKVVNLMPYGAFVELEPGVEGLVHISEMSWTKRINHPSEMLTIGEDVEVQVLGVDMEKQELSLGLKQTGSNPWDSVEDRFQVGAQVSGSVRNTTTYGAFIELEDGVDGLLHINDMSWTRKVVHPNEIVKKGETIHVLVLSVDRDKKRIALGLKQLQQNPWETVFPEKYKVGNVLEGPITKLVSFGAFVELEKDLEGLLHISKVDKDTEMEGLSVGDVVQVKVVKIEPQEGKIGLSLNRVVDGEEGEVEAAPVEEAPVAEVVEEAPAEEAAPVAEEEVSPAEEAPAPSSEEEPPAAE